MEQIVEVIAPLSSLCFDGAHSLKNVTKYKMKNHS